MGYTSRPEYQVHCLTKPIASSVVFGGLFSALDVAQGRGFSMGQVGRTIGLIYAYNALQCPMEAIHGRPSLLHNIGSAATLGYVGFRSGLLGVPFVDPYTFYRYPFLKPAQVSAIVYGAGAGMLAMLGGKTI